MAKAAAQKESEEKRKKNLRLWGSLFWGGATIWIFLPAVVRIHAGMLWGVLTGIMFLFCAFPKLSHLAFRRNKMLARLLTIGLIASALVFGGTFSVLMGGGLKPTQPGGTVIILGCQVRGETPSLMLRRRIEVALSYARRYPDSKIIASGGQGNGEDISEAECIRRYLVANGIEEGRIYLEDRSTSTEENIAYSAKIIRREGLNPSVVIATSRFHQYRASLFARQNNLDSSPLACGTEFWLAPGYWGREIFAVWRVWLFAY